MVLSFLQQGGLNLNTTGTVILLLWIPATLFAFLYMKPWRAIILTHIVGYCVLPHGEIYVPALPDIDRMTVIALGCMLGVMWVRPIDPWPKLRWIDIPVLLWCSAPMISSLSNDLGLWDGISGASKELIRIGVPWLLARRFVHGPEEARVLASLVVCVPASLVVCGKHPHGQKSAKSQPKVRQNLPKSAKWIFDSRPEICRASAKMIWHPDFRF